MERLDKILSGTGRWSRREVKDLVRQGRVLLDDAPAKAPDQKIDPRQTRLRVDGEEILYERFTYLMLHKPAGVLSAVEDSRQKTVLDLLPEYLRRRNLSPVGRLDKDTEGLLLLTNDGDLAHRLLSPRHHVDKVYYARVEGALEESDVAAFAAGITLGDGLECLPAGLEILSPCEALVTLQEGKFHQVKRMLAARGKPVVYLKRLKMGPLTLDDALVPGAFRPLTEEECGNLQKAGL
ncbi:MAG: 16S rRNA pseudouridine(516) synthase [Ruminococcaceae bacterium]|nr:16S rRNA pseudouridine(516) synthase [Oscillospiraceae bacterium]